MRLNIDRLEKARIRGGKLIARCPVCAEAGADRRCEHLVVFEAGNGAFRCIADPDGAGGFHSKRIFALVGIGQPLASYLCAKTACKKTDSPAPGLAVSSPIIPPLRPLALGEMLGIANARNWSRITGLALLSRRGLLHYGEAQDSRRRFPSWIITDSLRRNAQARRLDGRPWRGIGDAKAKTLPGSQASWPIGAADIGDREVVVITEGMPDFCCTLLVACFEGLNPDKIAPVTITGAGHTIDKSALPYFRGKKIRIVEHLDAAGANAGRRWAEQLWQAGASSVDGFRFSSVTDSRGRPVKDLADFAATLSEAHPSRFQILADLS